MTRTVEKDLLELVSIYSPTGKEGMASVWFRNKLEENGFSEASIKGPGNASGRLPGSGLKILLCGHIDTVPGKLPVRISGDQLTGRGSVDAKSSLISFLHGALLAKKNGFHGTIDVIAAVGEEGSGKGIEEIAMNHEKADFAILGEPSGATSITVGYRGRLLIETKYRTGTFHASAPWMGKSAIESAIYDWNAMIKHYGQNSEFSKVSVALTYLRGGHAHNVTPSSAKMLLDVRYPLSIKKDRLMAEIKEVLELDGSKTCKRTMEVKGFSDPYVSNLRNDLVRSFKVSILEISGETPQMVFKSGSGDMSYLANAWNIPCITFGPGNTQLSHTGEERISIDEVEKCSRIIAGALIRLEELHW